MILKEARQIAEAYCWKLFPYCEEKCLRIAGSVRRKAPEVKDIEIVALPKCEVLKDLFGNPFQSVRHPGFLEAVNSFGKIIKGNASGKYVKIELPEGIVLDLFIPSPEDYFRQLAIRTGSADYVKKNVSSRWKKKGWCGSDKGLRKKSDCIEMKGPDGKSTWKCVKPNAELPPAWKNEEEFFRWLGVPFEAPELRAVMTKEAVNWLGR